jgi:hypothetical protein
MAAIQQGVIRYRGLRAWWASAAMVTTGPWRGRPPRPFRGLRGGVGDGAGIDCRRGARELNPQRSGLYLRYQLGVTYLLESKGVPPGELLTRPFDRTTLEQERREMN